MTTHRPAPELFLVGRHFSQPAPSGKPSARCVEQVEAIAVSDARHFPKQTTPPKPARSNIPRSRKPAQVGAPKYPYSEGGGRCHEREPKVARLGVVFPVDPVERVVPVNVLAAPDAAGFAVDWHRRCCGGDWSSRRRRRRRCAC